MKTSIALIFALFCYTSGVMCMKKEEATNKQNESSWIKYFNKFCPSAKIKNLLNKVPNLTKRTFQGLIAEIKQIPSNILRLDSATQAILISFLVVLLTDSAQAAVSCYINESGDFECTDEDGDFYFCEELSDGTVTCGY